MALRREVPSPCTTPSSCTTIFCFLFLIECFRGQFVSSCTDCYRFCSAAACLSCCRLTSILKLPSTYVLDVLVVFRNCRSSGPLSSQKLRFSCLSSQVTLVSILTWLFCFPTNLSLCTALLLPQEMGIHHCCRWIPTRTTRNPAGNRTD